MFEYGPKNKGNGRFGYHNYISNNNFVVLKRFGSLTDIILFDNYILFAFLVPYILTFTVTESSYIQLFFYNRILFPWSNYFSTTSFSSFGVIFQK